MYSFSSHVRYSECDRNAQLSLVSLINYLQDCSTFHCEHLGVGVDYMLKQHFAWFISAWQIWIDRIPHFNELITISTWSTGVRTTNAHRNFTIVDERGESCVRADSLWFVYDTKLHRPIRVPASEKIYDEGDPALDLPPLVRKLPVEGPFRVGTPITITSEFLDTNSHVNNAQYVRMAFDALEIPIEARCICVQYKRMALLGDIVYPHVHTQEGIYTVDLVNPEDQTYAIVRFEVRP